MVSATATTIVCTLGNKLTAANPTNDYSFEVSYNSHAAVLKTDPFYYANAWSDPLIWGGDAPPRDGDVVIVPKGQLLVVDIPESPKLYSVMVEGMITFSDEMDISFSSGHILIHKGILRIGTYNNPRQRKLTITLSGTK